MSFPAFEAFAADNRVRRVTFRVYRHLERERLNHVTPEQVKVSALSETLMLRPASIISALNWLTNHGYLIEHARASRRIRTFTLAWRVSPTISQSVAV